MRNDAITDDMTNNAARLLGKMSQGKVNKQDMAAGRETTESNKKSHNNSMTTQKHMNNEENRDEDDEDEEDESEDENEDNNDDNLSNSGFSNASYDEWQNCVDYDEQNNNKQQDETDFMERNTSVEKPLYWDELLVRGRTDTVASDVQLIKGVLPDLFAVLKFLEGDDDLVYKGTICRYFFKKLQVAESKQYTWWKQNCHAVRKSIDGRRASVSNLIKWSFMGTYNKTC